MLQGVRVLDLTQLLPGPYATMLLADMGAEVIKVERPDGGDYMRGVQPLVDGTSVIFQVVNRNKKSITLNLKHQQGKAILQELVKDCHVLIEGFRPGVMARLGLSYEDLQPLNPGLVYASLSGYGQTGSWRDHAGHDINFLAQSGVLGITGVRDAQPVIPGIQLADKTGGMFAAMSILAALLSTQKTGQGTYIDVSMVDGLISLASSYITGLLATGTAAKPGDMAFSGALTCYNVYATQDGGYVALGAVEPKFWSNFCKAVQREDLLLHHFEPAVEGNQTYEQLKELFLSRTLKQWQQFAQEVDCCLSTVDSLEQVAQSDYVKERNLLVDMSLPSGQTINQVRSPMLFSGQKTPQMQPAPSLGQHNMAVYSSVGYSPDQIDQWQRQQII